MSKRKRFILVSVVLSLGFVGIQFIEEIYRYWSIAFLSVFTAVSFLWSLREGLGKNLTLLSIILPTLFTVGVGLFWFLLPSSIYTRIPIVIFYGFGIYALSLTMNIYTVSAIRTIALLRAARGVGFVLSLVTSFLLYDTILSFKTGLILRMVLIFVFSLPIFIQGFWAVPLTKELSQSKKFIPLALISAVIASEVSVSLFFWPVTVIVGSLFLTMTMYVLLGLGQAQLEARLFKQTVGEYLSVGALVFLGMLVATHWG